MDLGLACLQIVLQSSPHLCISADEPHAQELGGKDQRCRLLVKPDTAAEKGAIRTLIGRRSSRDQDVREGPVRPAQITKNVREAGQRTFGNQPSSRFALVGQVAQDHLIAGSRELEHRTAAVQPMIGLQDPECVTEGLRHLHQRAKLAKGGQRDLRTDEESEMRTVGALHAKRQESAQGRRGEPVLSVLEEMAQAGVVEDRPRISPQLTQHRNNSACKTQVDEPTSGWA